MVTDLGLGNVVRTISPNDEMFLGDRDEDYYFATGLSALENIVASLRTADESSTIPQRILDLPCGHGRVQRWLRAAFPQAEITACDLLHDGVDFCASTFGAIPLYSKEDPTAIPFESKEFDLIWVGSLFTHLDSDRWTEFLDVFRCCLKPGAVLVFSTHGRQAYQMARESQMAKDTWHGLSDEQLKTVLRQYEHAGFGYSNYPDQSRYGISLSHPAWVCAQITGLSQFCLVYLREKTWVHFHDIFACVRDVDWQRQQPTYGLLSGPQRRWAGWRVGWRWRSK